jgi:hypothetical protein
VIGIEQVQCDIESLVGEGQLQEAIEQVGQVGVEQEGEEVRGGELRVLQEAVRKELKGEGTLVEVCGT